MITLHNTKRLTGIVLAALFLAAGLLLPFAATVAYAADYTSIRVRLTASLDDLNIGVNGAHTLVETGKTLAGDVNISLLGDGANLVVREQSTGTVLYTGAQCTITRQSGTLRQYNRKHGWRNYLGDMNYKVQTDAVEGYKIVVTNTIGLEDYLLGVVAYEMNNSWPLEALKAQAICARSYAVGKMSPNASYDIVDTSSDQVYKGYDAANTNVLAAVQATKGMVLTNSSGQVISAYYSASNGGQTETTENAWNSPLPYYPMKDDPYDLRCPTASVSTLTLPKAVSTSTPLDASFEAYLKTLVGPKLSALGYSSLSDTYSIVGATSAVAYEPEHPAPSISFTRVSATLLVSTNANAGTGAYTAPQFVPLDGIVDYVLYVNENRLVTPSEKAQIELAYAQSGLSSGALAVTVDFPFSALRSAGLFTNTSLRIFGVTETATGFDLQNKRFGHGVGMSQRGAKQMADEGFSFNDILMFYFTNVMISQVSTVDTVVGDVSTNGASETVEVALPEPTSISATLTDKTALRTGPGTSYSASVNISAGATVQVVGHHERWVLVLTESGTAGYLPDSAIALDVDDDIIVIAAKQLTLRNQPFANAAAMSGSVAAGKVMQLLATSGDWCLVDTGTTVGYAQMSDVELAVGGIDFATDATTRYGYASSAAPLMKSSTSDTVIATVPEGYVFEVKTQTKDKTRYNVVYGDLAGYVFQAQTVLLEKGAPHPNPKQLLDEKKVTLWSGTTNYVANTASLNLRAAPNASAAVLGTLGKDEKVVVLGTYGTSSTAVWKKVQSSSGLVGYVNGTYLSAVKSAGTTVTTPLASAPATSTPTPTTSSGVTGTVTASSLRIRASKSTSAEVLGNLEKGDVVTLLAQSTSWYKIQFNGVTGYVMRTYIQRNAANASGTTNTTDTASGGVTGTVNTDSLRIRASKSTSAEVLGNLEKGDVVTLLAQSTSWYKIKFGDITGYVMKTYVDRNSQTATSTPEPSEPAGTTSDGVTGTVTTDGLRIRASKSTSAEVLGNLKKGDVVTLLAQSTSWYKIQFGDITGYVMKTYVERNSTPATPATPTTSESSAVATGVINTDNVNFRPNASTSGTPLGKLTKGTQVDILAKSGDFYKIQYAGVTGYVAKDYVGSIKSVTTTTTTTTANLKAARVTATELNVRNKDGSKVLSKLKKGAVVQIISTSGDTSQVKFNGGSGFVSSKYLQTIDADKVKTVQTSVNFRTGPAQSYDKVEGMNTLSKGKLVEVLATEGDWIKINCDGFTGYVSAKYLA